MTTLTATDVAAGWFLVAGSLLVLGALVIRYGVSRWSEAQARKAERIISTPPFSPDTEASIHQALAVAAHWNDAADRLRESNVRLAAVTERMKANPPNLSLVPGPRKPGGLS